MASCEIQSGEFKIQGGTLTVAKLPAGRSKLTIQIDGAPMTELVLNENGYAIETKVEVQTAPKSGGSGVATFPKVETKTAATETEVEEETPKWKRPK
jgi:hypothetical protein